MLGVCVCVWKSKKPAPTDDTFHKMPTFILCLSRINIDEIESKQHFCLYFNGQTKYANGFLFCGSLSSGANVYGFVWLKEMNVSKFVREKKENICDHNACKLFFRRKKFHSRFCLSKCACDFINATVKYKWMHARLLNAWV